uniref:Uncharacterized protein n=1 Tax=Panagrolaimus davidi TaxID=227884 RepID=A0A914Q5M7_9BILA
MVKLWFCWIFFVLFFNKVVGEKAGEENFNVEDVTDELFINFHESILVPLQQGDRSNDDYNDDYANKEDNEGDKVTSDEINLPWECPPDPFKNKCPKECQKEGIGVKLQHFEPINKDSDVDDNQRQQFFEPFPTEHNQSQQTSDAVTSDEVDARRECPPDPFKNKCPKECQVINDDRGCSLCVCPSNPKTHDFEPTVDNIQGQKIFKNFPTEQHESQSEVIEIQNVAPTQILSENWSNLFLTRSFTLAEKSDEMNKSSNFEILFDKELSAAENETKSEVIEKTYSSTNETDPNTIADEILSGEIENKGDVLEAEEQLLFENDVYIDPNNLFQSIKIQNDNETLGINNIGFENSTDKNPGHNETSNNEIQEGSSSIDDEIFTEGSGNEKASVDDENGDAEDSDVTVFEENPTVEPKQKMIEMHKCLCTEIETCLTEVWGNEIFNYKETSDLNLLTKCSLTFLKSDCSNSFNPETKQIFANKMMTTK